MRYKLQRMSDINPGVMNTYFTNTLTPSQLIRHAVLLNRAIPTRCIVVPDVYILSAEEAISYYNRPHHYGVEISSVDPDQVVIRDTMADV